MLAVLLGIPFGTAAHAGAAKEAREYQECMALSRRNPIQAFERALAWRDRGGGHPARHCAAVALIGLGHHRQAAERLETLANDMSAAGKALRAGVLAHAGQAWLLAGDVDRAYAAQSSGLQLMPNSASLLIDRSATLAEAGQHRDAILDLNRALQLAPNRVDALIFRARSTA